MSRDGRLGGGLPGRFGGGAHFVGSGLERRFH